MMPFQVWLYKHYLKRMFRNSYRAMFWAQLVQLQEIWMDLDDEEIQQFRAQLEKFGPEGFINGWVNQPEDEE